MVAGFGELDAVGLHVGASVTHEHMENPWSFEISLPLMCCLRYGLTVIFFAFRFFNTWGILK